MNEKIENVYEFKTENRTDCFIYSVKNSNDLLGFYYYILMRDELNEPKIYNAGNTVKTLQDNGICLEPIDEDSEKYKLFLSELLVALKNEEKRKTKK